MFTTTPAEEQELGLDRLEFQSIASGGLQKSNFNGLNFIDLPNKVKGRQGDSG